MAATIQQTGGLGDLASAITALMPALLGSGNKKESGTSTSTIDPALMQLLNTMIQQTTVNANDPKVTQDIVNDIITKASQAFAPTLGNAASSGLYNSSAVSLLASRSQADATSAASKAVLDYKTNQQQIAAQLAVNLGNLTKSTSSSTSGKTGSVVPTNISGMIGGALLAKSLWNKKDDLLGFFGAGDGASSGATYADQGLLGGFEASNLPIPPIPPGADTTMINTFSDIFSDGGDVASSAGDFINIFSDGSAITETADAASTIWDDLLQLF